MLAAARAARKLAADYRIPDDASNNSPRAVRDVFDFAELRASFPSYPLGTEMTPAEQQLIPALEWLQLNTATAISKFRVLARAITSRA